MTVTDKNMATLLHLDQITLETLKMATKQLIDNVKGSFFIVVGFHTKTVMLSLHEPLNSENLKGFLASDDSSDADYERVIGLLMQNYVFGQ